MLGGGPRECFGHRDAFQKTQPYVLPGKDVSHHVETDEPRIDHNP
jgi:hypothetical protein